MGKRPNFDVRRPKTRDSTFSETKSEAFFQISALYGNFQKNLWLGTRFLAKHLPIELVGERVTPAPHWVAGGSHPPPAPTERRMRIW